MRRAVAGWSGQSREAAQSPEAERLLLMQSWKRSDAKLKVDVPPLLPSLVSSDEGEPVDAGGGRAVPLVSTNSARKAHE